MRFVYRTYVKTTPDRLWQALTEPDLLRRFWFGCEIEMGHAPGEPFSIRYKGELTDDGEILAFEPPKRLSYSFRNLLFDEPSTQATFTLEPRGDAVKLTLIHDGFEEGSRLLPSIAGGWPSILSSLKSLLEGVEPDVSEVEIADGPLDSPLQTVYRMLVAAPPEKVWEGLTLSAFTERYFFGRRVESDWKVGSPVRYLKPDGSLDVSGVVREAQAPRRLTFTWEVEGFEHPACWVTFEIDAFGPVSRLTLTESHGEALDEKTLEGGRQGWPAILSGLKTLLETGTPLGPIPMHP